MVKTPRTLRCPFCTRMFSEANAVWQHARDAHNRTLRKPKRPGAPEADGDSLAALAIEAEMKQAMGLPLDPLEESLLP